MLLCGHEAFRVMPASSTRFRHIVRHQSPTPSHSQPYLLQSSISSLSSESDEDDGFYRLALEKIKEITKKVKALISGEGVGGFKTANLKERMSKLGLYALLSYGFVSNVSYITCLIISWVAHGKRSGLSPLAPNQWKAFMVIYAGLWAANNILRPLRFSLAIALSPAFERLIDIVHAKTGFKRPTCTGIVVFLVNVCGTFTYLFGGLLLATTINKVPLLP